MFEIFPTLHTERLDLVEIKIERSADIFKLFGDKRVTKFYNVVTLANQAKHKKLLTGFITVLLIIKVFVGEFQ